MGKKVKKMKGNSYIYQADNIKYLLPKTKIQNKVEEILKQIYSSPAIL